MAISDADYTTWINKPNASRVLLVEAKAYSGGAEVTRYLSTDSAGSFGYYDASIEAAPIMSRQLSQTFTGFAESGFGFLDISNSDARFDSWIYDSFGGREINFFIGDPSWDRSDFRQIFTGKTDRMEVVNDKKIRLHVRDRHADLDKPIQESTFTAAESTEAEGEIKPLCFGKVFNIAPVLIDATTHKYKIHDGEVNDVCTQLYVNGATSAIVVTKDNVNGEFTLASDPSGTVTVDAEGAKFGGVLVSKPGLLIAWILITYSDLAWPGDYDTDSVFAFDAVDSPDVGHYLDKRINLIRVLDEIAGARMGYYYFNRLGQFTLGYLYDPSIGTSVIDLNETNTSSRLNFDIDEPPRWKTTVGYKKNFTVYNKGVSLTEADKNWREKETFEAVYEDPNKTTIQAEHLDATAPDLEPSLIVTKAEALTEAQYRQELFNTQRYRIRVSAFASGYLADIGDIGSISDSRYGLNNQKFVITRIEDNLVENQVIIEGWF